MSFSAPPALRNTYEDQCKRDPASPLPNARRVSIEFHPNITHEDNTVSEEIIWGMTSKRCNCSHQFTGYSNGDAIWPVPWPWSNTDHWIRGQWLLRRGCWALCTWLLPHTLCWLRPNICQPGININCWKNAPKLIYCSFLQEYIMFFIWSSFIRAIQQIMIYIT